MGTSFIRTATIFFLMKEILKRNDNSTVEEPNMIGTTHKTCSRVLEAMDPLVPLIPLEKIG